MQALVEHLLAPVLRHPASLRLQVVEGEAATIIEAVVHADDRDALEDDGERTLRAVRTVVSAAAGRTRATFELVDELSDPATLAAAAADDGAGEA
jgi:predicted RNA-binding protein YlqC (UPF0109 family)